MKKRLLPFAFSMAVFGVNAQTTVILEDFESGAIPTGWTQETVSTDGGYIVGTSATLSSQSFPFTAHTKFAGTNDDNCNCDKSNDKLITASIAIPATGGTFVSFDLFYAAGSYQGATETAAFQVSTNGGTTWTDIATLPGNADWTTLTYSLAAYAGQSVKFAFVYNDDGGWLFGLGLDNFKVFQPVSFDVAAVAITSYKYYGLNEAPIDITGDIFNYGGSAITSFDINYSVNNGATVTQNITGVNIPGFSGYSFTHPTTWTPTAIGTYSVKVWASNLNGNADMVTANDEVTKSILIASNSVARTTLLEELTSSTCFPCQGLNAYFDPLLTGTLHANKPGQMVAAVKYQMNWPDPGNDPSYNPDGDTRKTYYGTTGIPDAYINGEPFEYGSSNLYVDIMAKWQNDVTKYNQRGSIIDLGVTYNLNGDSITVYTTHTPFLTGSGFKLHVAVTENHYTYTASETDQDEYHFVERKMLPNGNGTALTLTDGQSGGNSFGYKLITGTPAQGNYNLWNSKDSISVVAFIQNTTTKHIYQAALATFPVGIAKVGFDYKMSVFPNPCIGNTNVYLNLENTSDVSVRVMDMAGKVAFNYSNKLNAGSRTVDVDLSNVSNGLYLMEVSVDGAVRTEKISVNR